MATWQSGISPTPSSKCSGNAAPFLSVRLLPGLSCMQRGEPLIYGGRIQEPGLLGDPDLLRKETGGLCRRGHQIGCGGRRPGRQFFTQAPLRGAARSLYGHSGTQGLSPGRRAFVWDIHGKEVPYDFMAVYGTRNFAPMA